MNPHGVLTEPSLSPHHRLTPGREGKGTGKGRGSLFPIHLPTVTVSRANRSDDGWAADAAPMADDPIADWCPRWAYGVCGCERMCPDDRAAADAAIGGGR